MGRYIKLYESLLDNPIVCKDGDHLAIWIYLLLNAKWSPTDDIFCGDRVTLQPGQLITGRLKIASALGVSESKVHRVLKLFEIEHQIEQLTSPRSRLITVMNWLKYQYCEQPDEQRVNNCRTTDEQLVNTIYKKDRSKEEKKERNSIPTLTLPFSSPEFLEAWRSFLEMRKGKRVPNTDRALALALKELSRLSPFEDGQIAILNQSTMRGWTGVFPVKEEKRSAAQEFADIARRLGEGEEI